MADGAQLEHRGRAVVTRIPRPATALGWTAGALAALYPGMLPRPVPTELALVVGLGTVGVLVANLCARSAAPDPEITAARAQGFALLTGALLLAATTGWLWWQQDLRSAAGAAGVPVLGAALLLLVAGLPYVFAAFPPRLRRRAAVMTVASFVGLGAAGTANAAPEGQRFLAAESASPGVRVYVPLTDGAGAGAARADAARAERAIDELLAAGALHREAIVVAVPTGSGWVDAHFVRGIEGATGGDVAIAAVQYTAEPSWQSYLFHRDLVIEQARALATAMHRRLPANAPPLLVYGQSLGALGAAAFTSAYLARTGPAPLLLGTVMVGTPVGVADPPGPVTRLLNRSDPVGVFGADLAWRPPQRADGGAVTPRPPWLPVISWLQTGVDLLNAIAQPSGVGHRYDERQGRALAAFLATEPALA